MKICIDAGHGLPTSGKRCLKRIDPAETREWTLNSRIAGKVAELLSGYECETFRVDDTTGKTDVDVADRVKAANGAKADLYVSIHHNAGIKGGAGGGIVVYTCKGAQAMSKTVQEALYRYTVAATGLRGNRSAPTPEAGFYVLKNTAMPAVLGEFGFMDSAVDTPIILTEEYADQVAGGIVDALAEVCGLRPKPPALDETRIRAVVREELATLAEAIVQSLK